MHPHDLLNRDNFESLQMKGVAFVSRDNGRAWFWDSVNMWHYSIKVHSKRKKKNN